jgi:hypothetical protein
MIFSGAIATLKERPDDSAKTEEAAIDRTFGSV